MLVPMHRTRRAAAPVLVAALALVSATDTAAGSFAITGVRVVDGTGAPPVEQATILVRAGRIDSVSTAPPPPDVRLVDGTGLTALPGLIDSHVHLGSVPGAVVREDPPEVRARMQREQLRATLAAGVTTVLDAAASPDGQRWVREHVAEGDAAPRMLVLAPFLTPEGGYFADPELRSEAYEELWDPIDGPERLVASLEAGQALEGSVGAKVVVETGVGPFEVWETWTPEMRARIRTEATSREIPLFVHSMTGTSHELALELGPRALVHGGYAEEAPEPGTLERIRTSGAYVISTMAIYDLMLLRYEPDRLRDPYLVTLVPAAQLATAGDDEAWDRVGAEMIAVSAPSWMPELLHPLGAWWFLSERAMTARLESAIDAIGQMHDAGIPIVAGTDAGTWPVMTTGFHGVSMTRELELLVRAGLEPGEAIVAATSRPARMLGIEAEVGTLGAGKRADLVLVRGDPLTDIRALRDVAYVVQAGAIGTPEDWIRHRPAPPAPGGTTTRSP